MQPEETRPYLSGIITHAPCIDMIGILLLGAVDVDEAAKTVAMNDQYRGAFLPGENIVGKITRGEDDPEYILDVKGREVVVKSSVLNQRIEDAKRHAELVYN